MRTGRKLLPCYRIVVVDSRVKRDGAYIELLGNVDKIHEQIVINETKILHWLNQGAQPTDTVRSILQQKGLWAKFMATKPKQPKKAAAVSK